MNPLRSRAALTRLGAAKPLTGAALAKMGETSECCSLLPLPPFDEALARGLSSQEVRKRWPRAAVVCPQCGSKVVLYASMEHLVAGDW